MITLPERIKKLKKATGWNNTKVAYAAGTSCTAVTCWLKGNVKALSMPTALRLSNASGFSLEWLASGEGKAKKDIHRNSVRLSECSPESKFVPIVSFRDTVKLHNLTDASELQGKDYVVTNIKSSPKAFALEINDASMSPQFEYGDLVIIDPEVYPSPGDYVAACYDGRNSVFRQYHRLPINEYGREDYKLFPLNKIWPEMRSDRTDLDILGVMLEHRKFRKI